MESLVDLEQKVSVENLGYLQECLGDDLLGHLAEPIHHRVLAKAPISSLGVKDLGA